MATHDDGSRPPMATDCPGDEDDRRAAALPIGDCGALGVSDISLFIRMIISLLVRMIISLLVMVGDCGALGVRYHQLL